MKTLVFKINCACRQAPLKVKGGKNAIANRGVFF